MKIGILVWGSLYWDPRNLNTTGEWFFDGPILPIEFSRISGGNRLTLVITPGFDNVTTLFAISGFDRLSAAIENLKDREGAQNINNIGYINFQDNSSNVRLSNRLILPILRYWNIDKKFEAIIWSDFSQRFETVTNTIFNLQNVIQFIERLSDAERIEALRYIRQAPEQINTRFRLRIQERFKAINF